MKNINVALEEMKEHARLDRFVQGEWIHREAEVEGKFRGCFFGCAMQSSDNPIEEFCSKYEMPEWLGFLSEVIFEGLPEDQAKLWPVQLLELLKDKSDFDDVDIMHKLSVKRLKKLFDENENEGEVKDSISGVIKCHENYISVNNQDWSEARSAAESAARSAARSASWSAARSAARSAAESAAWSAAESAAWSAAAWSAAWSARSARSARSAARSAAESAAWSARSAAWSARSAAESAAWSARSAEESAAWSAAESAAWSAERNNLIELLG